MVMIPSQVNASKGDTIRHQHTKTIQNIGFLHTGVHRAYTSILLQLTVAVSGRFGQLRFGLLADTELMGSPCLNQSTSA